MYQTLRKVDKDKGASTNAIIIMDSSFKFQLRLPFSENWKHIKLVPISPHVFSVLK